MISFLQQEDPGMEDGQVVGNHVQESRKVRKSFHPRISQHNQGKCEIASTFNMEHRVTQNSRNWIIQHLPFFFDQQNKEKQFNKQKPQNLNFCNSCFIFETNCVFFVLQTKLPSLDSMKMDLDDEGHLVGTARCQFLFYVSHHVQFALTITMMGSTVSNSMVYLLSGVVDSLVTHLTTVDTLVGTPLKETPPSAKQTICVSPSVDCLKPNNSRVISIKINTDQEDTFVQKQKIASSRLFTFFLSKNHFSARH